MWSCGIIMYMLLNNGEHPFLPKGSNSKNHLLETLKNRKPFEFYNKSISEYLY